MEHALAIVGGVTIGVLALIGLTGVIAGFCIAINQKEAD